MFEAKWRLHQVPYKGRFFEFHQSREWLTRGDKESTHEVFTG